MDSKKSTNSFDTKKKNSRLTNYLLDTIFFTNLSITLDIVIMQN